MTAEPRRIRLLEGGTYLDPFADYAWLREHSNVPPESLVGPENAMPDERYSAPQAWRTSVPEHLYPTSYVAGEAAGFLERWAADGADAPFMLAVSFPDPHHPFTPPGRYWDLYRPEDMPPPAAFAHPDWVLPALVEAAMRTRAAGRAALNGQASLACDEREAREAPRGRGEAVRAAHRWPAYSSRRSGPASRRVVVNQSKRAACELTSPD